MPRIRYLKPDFFKDEDLAEHPFWVRLLYQGLWNIADREGRLEDRPKRIKVDVFPYDNVDIEDGLVKLAKNKQSNRPFIRRYSVDGEKYIQIVNWSKHQKPHHTEKDSEIPPAPLKTMEKGKRMESVHEASGELSNGELTVKRRFIIPSIEEIKAYNTERNNKVDTDKFFDFYQSKGWMVGKNKMKDWRACIRTWEKHQDTQKDTGKKFNSSGYDAIIYAKLGKIATKDMIKSLMMEMPENLWWKVDAFLKKTYPGGPAPFLQAESELLREKNEVR